MGDRFHSSWLYSDRPIPKRFIRPVLHFTQIEAAGGLVLLAAAIVALVWANSPFHESYDALWELELVLDLEVLRLEETFREVVNDGLMAVFFFVVGLEIKRELVKGELRDPRTAALPVIGAVGGMIVPAAIYLALNAGGPGARGWGIPMATDIAFSMGVISLLGPRVPTGPKLFLLTLAIVDDIGVIGVIAVFYTEDLSLEWLTAGLVLLLVIAVAREVGVRSMAFYVIAGFLTWLAFLESGVHATIAGVALGLLTPAIEMYTDEEARETSSAILDRFRSEEAQSWAEERLDALALQLSEVSRESVAPLDRLERALHPWTSFFVIPLFALANSGVRFQDMDLLATLRHPVALGVALGLLVGKTVGISLFTVAAAKLGLGRLPASADWWHMVGAAALAGIGFTVSLFVTGLAFGDPELAEIAKLGIFAGSTAAGVLGYALLRTRPVGEAPPRP